MIYRFGHYQLDTLTCELYCDGCLCKVESRAFDILVYLIEHRDHIVSREELVENLWPGQIISQAVINNAIKAARHAIGDSGGGQHKIRTLHGRGYRFVAQAREQRLLTPMGPEAPSPHDALPPAAADAAAIPGMASQNVLVGDYRFVTVLCGTLDPPEARHPRLGVEVIQSLRRRFFALAKAEAKQQDATFKFFGADGFLLLLGLPVAHADHVKRAVTSGLRIRDCLYQRCLAYDDPALVETTLRLGVHTGLIELPSPRGHHEWTPLITSEAIARAIWLHHQAEGWTFLCSQSALPDLQAFVEYVEHGAIRVPDQGQPIMAYQIRGLATSSAGPGETRLRSLEATSVGRDD